MNDSFSLGLTNFTAGGLLPDIAPPLFKMDLLGFEVLVADKLLWRSLDLCGDGEYDVEFCLRLPGDLDLDILSGEYCEIFCTLFNLAWS